MMKTYDSNTAEITSNNGKFVLSSSFELENMFSGMFKPSASAKLKLALVVTFILKS